MICFFNYTINFYPREALAEGMHVVTVRDTNTLCTKTDTFSIPYEGPAFTNFCKAKSGCAPDSAATGALHFSLERPRGSQTYSAELLQDGAVQQTITPNGMSGALASPTKFHKK